MIRLQDILRWYARSATVMTRRSTTEPSPRVFLLGGNAQSLWNFRGPLIETLVAQGAEVLAGAPDLDLTAKNRVEALGAEAITVTIRRTGTNPATDLTTIRSLARTLRATRPTTFVGYTVKPVCLGVLAAALARVPNRVAMITGLGFAFGHDSWRQRIVGAIVRNLYRIALRFAHAVAFFNEEDRALFVRQGLVDSTKTFLVDGTGVDVDHFAVAPLPRDGPVTFALIARLLYDKGLREFAEAARMVRRHHPTARFLVAGPYDTNPAGLSPDDIDAWSDVIDYVGVADDVRGILQACDVYTLPSYREGIPQRRTTSAQSSR
ncbi:MAG: glycosyltransferase family 4 protein [Thioalkalivibrio sp.]|nr:glycosyltransferase family 4 protein [Thioalkalivibrio sp.]